MRQLGGSDVLNCNRYNRAPFSLSPRADPRTRTRARARPYARAEKSSRGVGRYPMRPKKMCLAHRRRACGRYLEDDLQGAPSSKKPVVGRRGLPRFQKTVPKLGRPHQTPRQEDMSRTTAFLLLRFPPYGLPDRVDGPPPLACLRPLPSRARVPPALCAGAPPSRTRQTNERRVVVGPNPQVGRSPSERGHGRPFVRSARHQDGVLGAHRCVAVELSRSLSRAAARVRIAASRRARAWRAGRGAKGRATARMVSRVECTGS